jgi:serine/threonine-protein kinase HipA
MVEQPIRVSVQIAGKDVPAGRLWGHRRGSSETATYSYLPDYLARRDAYELDPSLPLREGQQHTAAGQALFGAFTDCSPDGWGRRLVLRAEQQRARDDERSPRGLSEVDFLLGARDDLRQGALRFQDAHDDSYLAASDHGVPHLLNLPRLLNAAEELERDQPTAEDLRLLLEGASSLGGARPKAHVLDTADQLSIAKFPSPTADRWDVIRWESIALTLAQQAGITVPAHQLHKIAGRPVLVLRRFDREAERRLGYVSAMTMLGARDGEQGSYLEIAETLEEHSPHAAADLRELWRRIVFSVLISNTDDHLRNHGLLKTSTAGWSLSPAFDLNPNPEGETKRLSTAIDENSTVASIETTLEVAGFFGLTDKDARQIVAEVTAGTDGWRDVARSSGLRKSEIEQMEPAFEHQQRDFARVLEPRR